MVVMLLSLTLLVPVLGLYLFAARRQSRRRWPHWRTLSFSVGVGLLVAALMPGLMHWAHQDLRGHMVQHLLMGMFAPLALVLGAPGLLLLRTLPADVATRLVRFLGSMPVRSLTHPVTALVLNVGGMYLLYLTPVYARTLTSPLLHGLVHLHFLIAGYLFTWSIVGVEPVPRRPGRRTRLAVLFIAMGTHAALGKLMYAYGWPRGTPHALEEVQAAAQWMFYGGDLAELLLAMAFFSLWTGRGRRPAAHGRILSRSRAGG